MTKMEEVTAVPADAGGIVRYVLRVLFFLAESKKDLVGIFRVPRADFTAATARSPTLVTPETAGPGSDDSSPRRATYPTSENAENSEMLSRIAMQAKGAGYHRPSSADMVPRAKDTFERRGLLPASEKRELRSSLVYSLLADESIYLLFIAPGRFRFLNSPPAG